MLPAIAGADIAVPITRRWASSLGLWRGERHFPMLAALTKRPGAGAAGVQACEPAARRQKHLLNEPSQVGASLGTSASHDGAAAGRSAAWHLAA